ncbi:MAG: lipase family protein, partial [Cuspidothrix sp.]
MGIFTYFVIVISDSEALPRNRSQQKLHFVPDKWQQLQDFIQRQENANKNIFVTGHSLGGAAATLITKRISETELKPIAP